MSDYMFMLENHLNAEQAAFLEKLQSLCAQSNTSVFLAGGAMRDMLGGFPLRDLDFVVEGNALKTAKAIAAETGAAITGTDDVRKTVEMTLASGATASIAMSREERYVKTGGRPHVTPAPIQQDLRCRDFTINSIALSLSKASRGLLLDPMNGLADLERRELRAVHNYVLYDDPVRMWRMLRLKVRLGFAIEERTASQYANAREANVEKYIGPRALLEQLRQIAGEMNPGEVLKELEEQKLLAQVSPALTGAKLNLPGFAKLLKARQYVPFGIAFAVNDFALFLFLLTEKLTPKEQAALANAVAMDRNEKQIVGKVQARSKKLEKELKSAKLQKPSQVYNVLAPEKGEVILHLYLTTGERLVQDRIRNYLQKYILAAAEISDAEVEAEGLKPGTPKFAKRKLEKVDARLDSRPRKAPEAPVLIPELPVPAGARTGRL
jgi:tRNA nucleotidyltransferase/poly(A) polymerase